MLGPPRLPHELPAHLLAGRPTALLDRDVFTEEEAVVVRSEEVFSDALGFDALQRSA